MSGYDALDELYERLREQEGAERAGGITSETIRAARGGVVDENGRTPATAAENAADGDSAPLADISRDTRERIEADAWEAARLDMSRTWEERRDAIVALLDRQARLTEREYMERSGISELRREVDELQAELDAYDETHIPLPLDADGVPIYEGDMLYDRDGKEFFVTTLVVDGGWTVRSWGKYGEPQDYRHAKPRTLVDVLADFAADVENDRNDYETTRRYAAEIRELMEVGE